jgi:hypothetical protein
MAIKITVDGKTYDGIDAITVGGKVLTLAYVADSAGGDTGGDSGGNTGGENTGGNVPSGDALPTDGLQAYFDFRTASYNNAGSGSTTTIDATQGDGHLFAWETGGVGTQDEYGIHFANGRPHMYSKNKNTTETNVGNQMTMIMLTYGHVMAQGFNFENVGAKWAFRPKYKFSNGSEATAELRSSGKFNSDNCDDYNFCVYRVDGNILTEIMDTSTTTYDGSAIQDFASWITTAGVSAINSPKDGIYCTAAAIYNRALSDVEIEEARAFFKTLEVVS